ncbi:phage integrase SAM-like domain-containing protein, partial [Alistipes sp. An116]|uniref:phage integrase SAM-like domain-containing protein n=1 Tax=Alistipes sp. An116 TaxID=1965546 RepID=UPI00194FC2A7
GLGTCDLKAPLPGVGGVCQNSRNHSCAARVRVPFSAPEGGSILAAYDRLIQENRTPTCFAVKQLLGSASSSRMVLAEFGKYCEKRQQEVGTRITQLTANKYHRLLRYMTEYIRDIYHKEDLPLETIDYAYVDGLNTYMQTAYNCHNNGAVNLLCCLKNFILYAIRNEWIEKIVIFVM